MRMWNSSWFCRGTIWSCSRYGPCVRLLWNNLICSSCIVIAHARNLATLPGTPFHTRIWFELVLWYLTYWNRKVFFVLTAAAWSAKESGIIKTSTYSNSEYKNYFIVLQNAYCKDCNSNRWTFDMYATVTILICYTLHLWNETCFSTTCLLSGIQPCVEFLIAGEHRLWILVCIQLLH